MLKISLLMIALLLSGASQARLPALTDDAKAKAAEAAAKAAWSGKLDAFQLCKAQDRMAATWYKSAKASGKETHPARELPACADPGPFAYAPAGATPAAAPAAAPAPPAAAAAARKS
jgi:hypothetical protein